jgi:hypothetical protein
VSPGSRTLLASLLLFATGLGGIDAGLARYAGRHFVPNQLLRKAIAAGDRCVVVIGDSRTAAGVDPVAVATALGDAHAPACVAPLGIGAVGLEGQTLALRRYLSARRAPRLVVLGAGLLLPSRPMDPSEMVGNVAIDLDWSRASDVESFFPGFPVDALDPGLRFSIARTNALQTYASLVWARVQIAQSRLAGETRGPANRFGLVSDMRALAATFAEDAATRLEREKDHWSASRWFEAIDALARAEGTTVLVVQVPMATTYRRAVDETPIWRDYAAWLAADLARRGDAYIDLSASVDDARFADGVHVDEEGARTFSDALGRAIAPHLAASARSL